MRCCPWELAVLRQITSTPAHQMQAHRLVTLEGTLRHAMLLCGHPKLTKARESMFDAAEAVVAPALRDRPIPNAPLDRRQRTGVGPPAAPQIVGPQGLVGSSSALGNASAATTFRHRPGRSRVMVGIAVHLVRVVG